MARCFKQSVFCTGHQVLFVLEEKQLVSDCLLEVFIGAFTSDDAVDEVAFGDLCVDQCVETVWLEDSYLGF